MTRHAGPSRHRARRGEGGALRDRIVEAAAALLAESGDEKGVSVRAVAEAVGVTPPSLYLHFADKTALLRAVIERLFNDLEQEIAFAQSDGGGPKERVWGRSRAYIAFGLTSPGRYKVLYEGRALPGLAVPGGGIPGRSLLEAAANDLREAARTGELSVTDPDATAVRLWQFLHGVVSLRINKPSFPWRDAWADAAPGIRALIGDSDPG